ncbi:Trans-enoyl reductase actts2 [Alternaria postmessia]|uniref:Trans-enoyl reductase actts2 n=1 Tax=Alternaria postmessia TaxID=1187938 RepID=UPI002225B2D3|nr:Trans-enoyl reductase actts2 [Alternaria postmessia]KAH8621081.1 enoyl reductase [Alternaria alternata]KAI5361793.1 Trans-enoyl reductase actts2 [Alternaria postmessia]OWY53665.1 enoyl reductase [Alternaria alternata]
MLTRRALVVQSQGEVQVEEIPLPTLRDEYITVKVKAVALNPGDWKMLYGPHATPGSILGCDYSGVVEKVGRAVNALLTPGDRVAGFAFGGCPYNHDEGGFASYVTAKGDIQAKLSDSISFEDAATLGVGITTVGQAMYQALGLPLPPAIIQEAASILVYGASTATGTLAVQYAKLTGLKVFATASPHNFDLLKKLGADEVFDYRDPECGAKIRTVTNGLLSLVFDTISEGSSPAICAAAMGAKGGKYTALLPIKNFPRSDVKVTTILGYTALGVKVSDHLPANQKDFEFSAKFWKLSQHLLEKEKIKTHPVDVRQGGIDAIPQGLQDLKNGRVSGVKLVYKID